MKKFLPVLLFLLLLQGRASAVEIVRQKNTATVISFPITNTTGAMIVNATGLTSQFSSWNDTSTPSNFTTTNQTVTQIQTAGRYYLNLTQTEMNVDYLYIKITSNSSGAVDQDILIRSMVGDPLNLAVTDDGGAINVTSGRIDNVTAVVNGVTVSTNNDKTGYTASTVSDKTGYSLSSPQTFNLTGNVTGSLSGSVGSVTAGVTVTTNNDKTGYSLTQAFPTNFASMKIAATGEAGLDLSQIKQATAPTTLLNITVPTVTSITNDVGITQTGADKAWGTATRLLTAGTNIVLAKGTGITGFNDITAVNVWDTNISAYSGVGYAGTYLKNLWDKKPAGNFLSDGVWTDAKAAYLDAAISSRSTYAGGAVASVTGDIGGNVTGSVGSLAAQAKTDVENATWEATAASHNNAGTMGNKLNAAASAGDPWSTALPGAYGAGTAGYIVGNRVDVVLSSRGTSNLTASDNIGINWSDITNAESAQAFNNTTISISQQVASVSGTVGSVIGNVGGNVVGTVANVTGAITVGTNNDKSGYRLSATGVDDIWDEPQSGHTGAGTFGKYLDAQVSAAGGDSAAIIWAYSTRTLTSGGYGGLSAADIDNIWEYDKALSTGASAIGKHIVDNLNATVGSRSTLTDAQVWGYPARILTANTNFNDPSAASIAAAVWNESLAGYVMAGTAGKKLSDLPTSGTGDWTSGEKTLIKQSLGVQDGDIDTGGDLDSIYREIQRTRGR